MPDKVKGILDSIVAWWKRFTKKQQMILVSSVVIVALAIAILAYVLSRPEMVRIKTCESQKEAASVKELLDGEGIYNDVSDDGLVFTIKKKDQSRASILLGSNEIATDNPELKDVLSGGLSSTEADKNKLYKEYQEKYLSETLESLSNVDTATVHLNLPEDDGTLIAQQQEASAGVFLTLSDEMDEEQAAGLATMIATELGNETTDNISIMDSNMNLLFSGGTEDTVGGTAASQLTTKQKIESRVRSEVKNVVLGTGLYQNVEVGMNLNVNFGEKETTRKEYFVPEGRDEGYLSEESNYESQTTGGTGGVPGTDSNGEDGTTYMLQNGETSTQNITDSTKKYNVGEEITNTKDAVGDINYDNSSLSLSVKQYKKYDEDSLKADGTLKDMTFAQFRAQVEQQEKQKLTVDNELYAMVSNATGISQDRISIVAYEEPVFIESQNGGRTLADYLEIALAVLILALLGFVVFMSTRKEKQQEMEPELSVESLLQSTRENEDENLEDIGFKEKSEARMLIEKFVDEKPEAVASLLRNWLNEDWE